MEKHTLQFGQVTITVEKPQGFALDVDLHVHAQDEAEFNAAVAAFGGLAAFEPVDTDNRWLNTVQQGDTATVYGDLTLFVPSSMRGTPRVDPAMAALAEEQKAALAAAEEQAA